MREAIKQLSVDSIEIHAPDFDFDIYGGRYDPVIANQNLATRLYAALQSDVMSNQHQLPSLLSDRLLSKCIPPISSGHSQAHPK